MKRYVAMVVVLGLQAASLMGGTFPGSITREPLVRGAVSDRLSIGLNYNRIKRGINVSGVPFVDTLEADSVSGYVGYDVLPWLTGFVTAGGTSLRGGTWDSTDYGLNVSGGVHAYLWEADVLTPAFAAGRASIKGMIEIAHHRSDSSFGSSDWMEILAALPIGYEFFDRYPTKKSGVSTSLALYVGPLFSYLDGNLAVGPGMKPGFSSDRELGAVAGADIYFAPSFGVGLKVLLLDEVSTGASVRFHF